MADLLSRDELMVQLVEADARLEAERQAHAETRRERDEASDLLKSTINLSRELRHERDQLAAQLAEAREFIREIGLPRYGRDDIATMIANRAMCYDPEPLTLLYEKALAFARIGVATLAPGGLDDLGIAMAEFRAALDAQRRTPAHDDNHP